MNIRLDGLGSFERGIRFVLMAQNYRNGFTVKDIERELNIKKSWAKYILVKASLVLPIYEDGKRRNKETGCLATVYRLLED